MAAAPAGRGGGAGVYNIVPEDASAPHPAFDIAEVRAAASALRGVQNLRWPTGRAPQRRGADVLDWLAAIFRFQSGNVRNQREHLLLLLSNTQMRLYPRSPTNEPRSEVHLKSEVVTSVCEKLTANYTSWCNFLRIKVNLLPSGGRALGRPMELIYCALYLLIWGEAANVRFMPECLCYIFHHMAGEVNELATSSPASLLTEHSVPQDSQGDGFLEHVIQPLYNIVKAEADSSRDGKAPHWAWRNYDDMNEYFWNKRCFREIGWPLRLTGSYFLPPEKPGRKVGKTGFVEQRSFFNLFQSFDRVWVLHVLMFQALALIAWDAEAADRTPWMQLAKSQDTVAVLLTCFITWAFLRLIFALLTVVLQRRLVKRETLMVGVRMLLKIVVAAFWLIFFSICYWQMWRYRQADQYWSGRAQGRFRLFLYAAAAFCLPQALGLLAALLPWLARAIETSDWRAASLLTWWFQSHLFVGRGLLESTWDTICYSLFWIILLAGKFSFSYFLQIKPMVAPTQQLLDLEVVYRWPNFNTGKNVLALICLWAPAILVYVMDIQIWYSVLSSVVGLLSGLFKHIGEARNAKFLLLRFQHLPDAVSFNLTAPDVLPLRRRAFLGWWGELKRYGGQLRLRYGRLLPQPAKRGDARFAILWNGIVESFREEDLISNREVELLKIPEPLWRLSVPQWPALLLANELMRAVTLASAWRGSSRSLWRRVCAKEYRRCAVIESYEVLKCVLRRIVAAEAERAMLAKVVEVVDAATAAGTGPDHDFGKSLHAEALPAVRTKVADLLCALSKRPEQGAAGGVVKALQDLHEVVVNDLFKPDVLRMLQQHNVFPSSSASPLYVDAITLPAATDDAFYKQVVRLQTILTTNTPMLQVPANLEARRRMAFFCNSVFMDMPSAPKVEHMRSFCVMTPYYKETVAFNKKELTTENEDGITTLFYLQKIFPDEWENLEERLGCKQRQMWQMDGGHEICLWASYRGQTLTRTVRGMMYYRRALEMQALLEEGEDGDEPSGFLRDLGERIAGEESVALLPIRSHVQRAPTQSARARMLCNLKYTYVVTCQVYGKQKKEGDPKAAAILELMKKYEALRVAYVDDEGGAVYSVLVKWDSVTMAEQEVYRVRLPGPMKLGEGKPENQNHAIIFTRGDALQTIDMNQENYLEEALKLRNLLQEFDRFAGVRRPALLGLREHVFTGGISSLAGLMSAQETAFVTLGQRVLANPLKVRMHYGHPDVFDRLWFITRGGVSKASRVINISEDIFAGFNCTLRGGTVTHHEYMQVGKGRDVGLNQIALFEAKVASGNGEQTLSRDVYRLGHRLDFFRMLSFYYTSVGFYACTMLTAFTVYAFLWSRCYLALSGVEDALALDTNKFSQKALITVLNQQFLVQIGIFTALPMIMEYALEFGFPAALWDFFLMQLQLASVFFTFSLGTKTHYYGRTILHGGAKYRETGRGFVVRHETFAVNYRMYARSHFVKAFELMVLLIIYQSYTKLSSGLSYYLLTIASWFLALSWMMAPFVFNPSGFDWLKMVDDWKDFCAWLWRKGGVLAKEEDCWEVWWKGENIHLRTTGPWGLVAEAVLALRFFLFQWGIVYQLQVTSGSSSVLIYVYSWGYFVVLAFVSVTLSVAREQFYEKRHLTYRVVQLAVFLCVAGAALAALLLTSFDVRDIFASAVAFLPTGWGLLQLAQVLAAALPGGEESRLWAAAVVPTAQAYELLLAAAVALPVAVLSWLPGVQDMQTRILFNQAFSRGLQISRILVGKKPNPGF